MCQLQNCKKGVCSKGEQSQFDLYSYEKVIIWQDIYLNIYKMISRIPRTPIAPTAFALMSFLHFVIVLSWLRTSLWVVLNKNLTWEEYKLFWLFKLFTVLDFLIFVHFHNYLCQNSFCIVPTLNSCSKHKHKPQRCTQPWQHHEKDAKNSSKQMHLVWSESWIFRILSCTW